MKGKKLYRRIQMTDSIACKKWKIIGFYSKGILGSKIECNKMGERFQ